jgi:hypothetical protein
MISSTYLMIFGAVLVVIVAGVVLWKWWKKTPIPSTATPVPTQPTASLTEDSAAEATVAKDPPPPPMLFAVNDNGNLDLTDFNNKILDSSFGPNPKIYLSLLAQVTKDVTETTHEEGTSNFTSNVGNTKLYQVGDYQFIVNYTRLI